MTTPTASNPQPFVLPDLEANEKKALKKFNETGEVSPLLMHRFDQNGKFRLTIDKNKRGHEKTLELVKAIKDFNLPAEKVSSTTPTGGKILNTGFYDKDSLQVAADWEVIKGGIMLHLAKSASFPNLVTCGGLIRARSAQVFLAPNLEESHGIELPDAEEINIPKLKRIGGSLSTNATTIILPSLAIIDGSIDAKSTKVFEAPNLEKAWSIDLLHTKKLEFPKLKEVRGILQSMAKVLLAPKLLSVGDLSANGCDGLDLSSLKKVERTARFSNLSGTIISELCLPALEEVDEIAALKVESLKVPSLKKVGLGIAGYSSLKDFVVPDHIPLKQLYITDELLASIKEARIPRLQKAGETTLIAEEPKISLFPGTRTEGYTADCTFWARVEKTKTAKEAATTFRHAKFEVKAEGGGGRDNWLGVRCLHPMLLQSAQVFMNGVTRPVEGEEDTCMIPCQLKVFLSGKSIDAARRELDKLYPDITTCWDNGIVKSEDQQICLGFWGFSIRESHSGELNWDERRKPREPWGNIWQRQPDLYPWEGIQASDSLEEAIDKAKTIYEDFVMPLSKWELKYILSATHPNFEG